MSGDDAYLDARQQMVREQLQRRGITAPRVIAAMANVPREMFASQAQPEDVYADRALPIECGQTISQPYIVGLMTQALESGAHRRALEIGTGSGYQTAILAELYEKVVSIERHADLSTEASRRLARLGCDNVDCNLGDGTLGYPPEAPYDAILVAAATDQIPPALLDQLADGGRLVIPLGDSGEQVLQVIHRDGDRFTSNRLCGCRFVPLVRQSAPPD